MAPTWGGAWSQPRHARSRRADWGAGGRVDRQRRVEPDASVRGAAVQPPCAEGTAQGGGGGGAQHRGRAQGRGGGLSAAASESEWGQR
eukprot:3894093-Pleurochrysis_carterae.AAC.1